MYELEASFRFSTLLFFFVFFDFSFFIFVHVYILRRLYIMFGLWKKSIAMQKKNVDMYII